MLRTVKEAFSWTHDDTNTIPRIRNILKKSALILFSVVFNISTRIKFFFILLTDKFPSFKNSKPRIMSLDVHFALADELIDPMREKCVITNWSLSGHRKFSTTPRRLPVPLRFVNTSTWQHLDEESIRKFRKFYRYQLAAHKGAVVTNPPAFAEIFLPNLATLCVTGTRYEYPYTFDSLKWQQFNQKIETAINANHLIFASNNRADAEYYRYYSGHDIPVVPSLRPLHPLKWTGQRIGERFIYSRNLQHQLSLLNNHKTRKREFSLIGAGTEFNWNELLNCGEILIFPQNISTMFLFELATAGIPVAVPNLKWMGELFSDQYVLQELSFSSAKNRTVCEFGRGGPADPNWDGYFWWWTERADFYDGQLMPNVRLVSSVEEFLDEPRFEESSLREHTLVRNEQILHKRDEVLEKFFELLSAQ